MFNSETVNTVKVSNIPDRTGYRKDWEIPDHAFHPVPGSPSDMFDKAFEKDHERDKIISKANRAREIVEAAAAEKAYGTYRKSLLNDEQWTANMPEHYVANHKH